MCGGGGSRYSQRSNTSSLDNAGSTQDGQSAQGGSGATESDNRCLINEATELEGTDPDALSRISIGDIYPIEMRDGRPCVVDFEGRLIGSILSSGATLLEDCIEDGWKYRAEIIDIDGRNCRVRITNKCVIDDRAMLSSLDSSILSNVSEGETLEVVVQNDSLCVVDNFGRVVGALAEAWTGVLIQCVEAGVEYQVEVETIDGGNCRVHITNVTQ